MTQVIAQNINIVLKNRERLFFILIAGILLFVSSYIYFVHSVIVNVVERDKIIKSIHQESTTISELESNYFSLKNKINLELAHSKGFQDSEVSTFISKKSLTAFVSHNEL